MKLRRPALVALVALSPIAAAGPVDDLRDGKNMDFDLVGLTYTYSGFSSGSGAVADEDAPAGCVEKPEGTLDISLDLMALGAPFPVTVPLNATVLNASTIRWSTDTIVDQCVTVNVNGTMLDLLVRRVNGSLTGAVANVPVYFDGVCLEHYNVRMDDTGGDAGNFLNIETYALCAQFAFLRIDFQVRNIDAVAFGGRGCPGDTNGDFMVDFADLNNLLNQFNQTGSGLSADFNGDNQVDFADLNFLLSFYNTVC